MKLLYESIGSKSSKPGNLLDGYGTIFGTIRGTNLSFKKIVLKERCHIHVQLGGWRINFFWAANRHES